MDIGTEVWVKSEALVWAPGVVLDCQAVGTTGVVKVKLADGAIVTSVYAEEDDPLRANELYIRNKERSVELLASLTGLEYLHEPALLHALSERFAHDHIYTSIGDILVAVNPLKPLDLYSQATIDQYKDAMYQEGDASSDRTRSSSTSAAVGSAGNSALADAPPHVFAIGAKAFGGLLKQDQQNQSILVSGESGSGKTESTKFLMQFLTSVGRDATACEHAAGEVVEIGRRILQTNPILESFGNAQTIRNDNSSRFGKFIKIQFGHKNEIVGAEIASYLLEKVRLIHQSPGERNFHIFYELLEGADEALLLELGLKRGGKYELLNAYGGPMNRRSAIGANQFAQRFAQTVQAFEDTGVDSEEQNLVFRILAALLHLGNVNFMMEIHEGKGASGTREESAAVTAATRYHFEKCAELLGVTTKDLESLLLTRKITAGSEVMVLKQNAEQAKDICRSLAKAIYGRVFSWLVRRLSDGINYCDNSDVYDYDAPEIKTIGILDIFGFESLDRNGFEQLCINYANERLQAQFNEFVFIKEQDVYVSEGIDWRSIPYPSNEACLSLFDDKSNGLFSLLDQECLMPKGSDEALGTKFYRYHGGNEGVTGGALLKHQQSMPKYTLPQIMTSFGRYLQPGDQVEKEPELASGKLKPFFASKMDRVKHQFVVHHFAGRVCYRIEQFVEKNLDMLPADASTVFNSSANAIVSAIGDVEMLDQVAERAPGRRRGSLLRAPSVSAQFKNQLDRLVDEIGLTEAHYVRCLKPNEVKRPGIFDRARMVEQLRSVGVLEALRIARAGYSVRLGHSTFIELFSGFRSLVPGISAAAARKSPHSYCESLVAGLLAEVMRKEGSGETKATKPTSNIFDAEEETSAADEARRHGVQVGKTLVFCKTEAFNKFSRLRLELRDQSATVLQRHYRGYRRRRRFQQLRDFVHRIQSIIRGFIARKQVKELKRARQERAVHAIQRCWRRKLVRNRALEKRIRLFRLRAAFQLFRLAHTRLQEYVSEVDKTPVPEIPRSASSSRSDIPRSAASSRSGSYQVGKDEEALTDVQSWASLKGASDSDESVEKAPVKKKSSSRSGKQQRVQLAAESESSSSSDEVPRRKTSSRAESHRSQSKRKLSKKKKRRDTEDDDRNFRLENEILRLKQMLLEKQNDRGTSRSDKRSSRSSHRNSRFGIEDMYPDPMDFQARASRRSLSMDEIEFSAGEDEDGDEVSLLPPRRAQSVYHTRQVDHVSMLSQKIEELDAKCKFLEQLVARKSFDESSRSSNYAYSQRSSGSGGGSSNWDHRRYPSVIDTGGYGDSQFSERSHGPNGDMDGMIRNIQQQMDMLRQSMVQKEEAVQSRREAHPTSYSSSRRTRSSSAASSGSLAGLLNDHTQYDHGLMSPPGSHRKQPSSAGSGYSAGSIGFPPTPTSAMLAGQPRSLPIRVRSMSGSFHGGGGGGRHIPRIVKWARSNQCFECEEGFNIFVRRHHCRMCGNSFCHEHSSRRVTLVGIGFDDEPVRVCDTCFAEHYAFTQDPYPAVAAQYQAFPSYGGSSLSALASSHASAA
ncbi:Myosin-like protein [Globisporangium polare]